MIDSRDVQINRADRTQFKPLMHLLLVPSFSSLLVTFSELSLL